MPHAPGKPQATIYSHSKRKSLYLMCVTIDGGTQLFNIKLYTFPHFLIFIILYSDNRLSSVNDESYSNLYIMRVLWIKDNITWSNPSLYCEQGLLP